MNLHTFLIADSVLLDIAGAVALLVAALTFIGGLARRRQVQAPA